MKSEKKIIDVCAAVIVHDGAFLLGLRPAGKHLAGHWEFPGGKVHDGESLDACLERELKEELDVAVENIRHMRTLDHSHPEKTVRLHFMACTCKANSQPVAREHEAIRWVTFEQAQALRLAPGDRRFIRDWKKQASGDTIIDRQADMVN